MSRLGIGSSWFVQQNDGMVSVFNEYTEEEIVRFDPSDDQATAKAQSTIHFAETTMNDEEKSFAHFWCGYFYGCATR